MPKLNIIKREKGELNLSLEENDTGFITRNFDIFKKVVSVLNDLLKSISFEINEEGLSFDCMDSNHISYIKGFFPEDFFEEFKVKKFKSYGIPIEVLNKIFSITKTSMDMKMVFHDDTIDIEFDDSDTRKYYELKLLDISSERLEITDSDSYNNIRINSKEFNSICREINDIGSIIKIECFENSTEVQFESEGDMAKMRIIKDTYYPVENDCVVAADIKYMLTFSKLSSLSDKVSLRIDHEFPIKISYEFIRDAYLHFYLSPKIIE